jgi:K+-sensing histidine kinase KdpD
LKTGEALSTFRMRARPLDVPTLLYQALSIRETGVHSINVDLHVDLEKKLSPVLGDDQALLNVIERLLLVAFTLVQNAQHDRISLSVAEQNEQVVVTIRVGPGCLEATEFNAMVALLDNNDAGALELGDAGPSLAIVKGIVDLHEGRVTVENRADSGCRFRLVLPAHLEP